MLACVVASAWSAGCDQGSQHDAPRSGPYIQLLGANVGPNVPFDATSTIQLAFDRELLPQTINRQSLGVRSVNGEGVTSAVITYDPVTRVVTIAPPVGGPWLLPDQFYQVVLGVPSGDDDSGGIRAIDRATLDPSQARIIGFGTCPATGCTRGKPVGTPPPKKMRFCNDVLPIFTTHCSASFCHGAPVEGDTTLPASGLILQTSVGVAKTAVGHVAQGANTGASAGTASTSTHLFGIDMPIITPGSPASSWLVYKMLLSVPRPTGVGAEAIRPRCFPNRDAQNPPIDPFGGALPSSAPFTLLSDDERARLSDFVLGDAMPYPSAPGQPPLADSNLVSFNELERIRVWIEQGAEVDECGACEP